MVTSLSGILLDIRATSHMTLRARDYYTFKHSHWWKTWSRSKSVASHYAQGTNGVCECKMDVEVYMDSYMATNGSCFMVTWTILKKTTSWR